MIHRITVDDGAAAYPCREGQAVLLALLGMGVRPIPVGCRGGGCGVCRVEVLSGAFETGCMSAVQVDQEDRARGVALACQLFPRSDLKLRVLGRRPPSCN